MSILDKILPYLLRLKPFIWPLVVSVSSSLFFYFVVVNSSRFNLFGPQKSKKTNKNDELVVSLFANKIVLNDNDFSLINSNLNLFLTICSKTKLYVIVKVPDEASIATSISSLESSGAFKKGLAKHRVMFCQLPSGRISMVQQLQPHLHVEPSSEDVEFVNTKLLRQNVTTFSNMESILNLNSDRS